MIRWHAKMICGIIMLVDMPICFLLPIKLAGVIRRQGVKGQFVLDLLTCFAGGVFLASYLVFMAPAVRVLIEDNLMVPNHIEYPLPDMIIGLGFFGMLLLDKLVKTVNELTKKPKPSSTLPPPSKTQEDTEHSQLNGTSICNGTVALPFKPEKHDKELHELDLMKSSEESDESFDEEKEHTELDLNNISIIFSPNQAVLSRRSSRMEGIPPGVHATLSRQQSMVEAAGDSTESMTRSIIMMLALSIDSVLEGMTIGLKKTVIEVWAIFIGIIVHESVIAFCLGLQLVRIHRRRLPVVLASIVYTLMNPIGVIIATLIFENMETDSRVELANGILQALTSGCFIYVIFYEILEGQINQETPLSKILATLIGYVFLASFAAIPGSSSYVAHKDISHAILGLEHNGTELDHLLSTITA